MAFHTDGKPVETQITLNFIESATLDRKQSEYVPQRAPDGSNVNDVMAAGGEYFGLGVEPGDTRTA